MAEQNIPLHEIIATLDTSWLVWRGDNSNMPGDAEAACVERLHRAQAEALAPLFEAARAQGRREGMEESRRELELLRNLARAAAEFCNCPHDSFGCEASEEFTDALGVYDGEYPIQDCVVPACGRLYPVDLNQ